LGLKVAFKYTRRNIAIRVLFGIYVKEIMEKIINIDHRDIKAKYRFKAAFLFLVER
jgi:hypothetical protein